MQLQSFSGANMHIRVYTHKQLSIGEGGEDCTHTYTYIQAQVAVLKNAVKMTGTYTHPCSYPRLIAGTTHTLRYAFLHDYRSVSLARMRRYTQLAYLFLQCQRSFLSTDDCIADWTVRHQSVELPFLVEFVLPTIDCPHTCIRGLLVS